MPSRSENNRISLMHDSLRKIHSVTLSLQRRSVTMGEVRALFDGLCTEFPSMKNRLLHDSDIVTDPVFEMAVSKVVDGKASALSLKEKQAISDCRREVVVVQRQEAPSSRKHSQKATQDCVHC
jgi:hypothetical protein